MFPYIEIYVGTMAIAKLGAYPDLRQLKTKAVQRIETNMNRYLGKPFFKFFENLPKRRQSGKKKNGKLTADTFLLKVDAKLGEGAMDAANAARGVIGNHLKLCRLGNKETNKIDSDLEKIIGVMTDVLTARELGLLQVVGNKLNLKVMDKGPGVRQLIYSAEREEEVRDLISKYRVPTFWEMARAALRRILQSKKGREATRSAMDGAVGPEAAESLPKGAEETTSIIPGRFARAAKRAAVFAVASAAFVVLSGIIAYITSRSLEDYMHEPKVAQESNEGGRQPLHKEEQITPATQQGNAGIEEAAKVEEPSLPQPATQPASKSQLHPKVSEEPAKAKIEKMEKSVALQEAQTKRLDGGNEVKKAVADETRNAMPSQPEKGAPPVEESKAKDAVKPETQKTVRTEERKKAPQEIRDEEREKAEIYAAVKSGKDFMHDLNEMAKEDEGLRTLYNYIRAYFTAESESETGFVASAHQQHLAGFIIKGKENGDGIQFMLRRLELTYKGAPEKYKKQLKND